MFFRTPAILRLLYPKLVWKIPTTRKVLYLTFDDGPVPGPTDFVLETLQKHNAKATFFCIGNNVKENRALFDRLTKEGHAVGNHTYSHKRGWGCTTQEYISDVAKCEEVIGKTSLFRPPYGRITRNQLSQLSHFKVVMWDVLSYDYSTTIKAEKCLKGVIAASRPGSIVVFHDSYKAEANMKYALPRVIDHFSQHGFVFESLAEL